MSEVRDSMDATMSVADHQDEVVTALVGSLGDFDAETLEAVADAARPQEGWLPSMLREYLTWWREIGERP